MTAPASFIPTVSKGLLGDVGGADLVLVFVDSSQIPTRAMATVADITAEITGVAESRLAATGSTDDIAEVLEASYVETGLVADTDGATDIIGWWTAIGELGITADADMRLVAWIRYPAGPVPGSEALPVELPSATVFARAKDEAAATTGGLPDTTGADAGDVYTVTTPGDPAQFQAPTGGGAAPVDAELYDLYAETPGPLTLDMTAHPVGKAAAYVLLPTSASANEVTILPPSGTDYGDIPITFTPGADSDAFTVEVDGFSTDVRTGTGPIWTTSLIPYASGLMLLGPDSSATAAGAPSGAAGGDLAGTYPNPTVPGLADKVDTADVGTAAALDVPASGNAAAGEVVKGDDTRLDVAATTHAATGKTTPVDADELALVDSAASNVLKKLTWANVKATLKAYFDPLYRLAPTAAKTTGYTAVSGEYVPVDTTSGTVAITLPAAPAVGDEVQVKRVAGATNTATVITQGSHVYNAAGGSTTATLTLLNQHFTFVYAGSNIWLVDTGNSLTQLDTRYLQNSLYDANTILAATTDNTPVALTVAASRIVGRKATGDIGALTGAEVAAVIGGWQTITDTTVAVATASLSANVTGFKEIRFRFVGRSATTGANQDALRGRFNSDSGSNYATGAAALTTSMALGNVPSSLTNTDRTGRLEGQFSYIPASYLVGTNSSNNVTSTGTGASTGTTAHHAWIGAVSNAPTSFDLFLNTGANFPVGTQLLVEGRV